jgi:hypothetical protein
MLRKGDKIVILKEKRRLGRRIRVGDVAEVVLVHKNLFWVKVNGIDFVFRVEHKALTWDYYKHNHVVMGNFYKKIGKV